MENKIPNHKKTRRRKEPGDKSWKEKRRKQEKYVT